MENLLGGDGRGMHRIGLRQWRETPASGPVIVMANHPFGLIEGAVLFPGLHSFDVLLRLRLVRAANGRAHLVELDGVGNLLHLVIRQTQQKRGFTLQVVIARYERERQAQFPVGLWELILIHVSLPAPLMAQADDQILTLFPIGIADAFGLWLG